MPFDLPRSRMMFAMTLCLLTVAVEGICADPGQPSVDALPSRFEATQIHMGTAFKIVLFADCQERAQAASDAAFERIAELDRMMSDYRDDSELTKVTQSAGSGPIAVSDELFGVLQRSVELSKMTDGAFDITVGPAVRLWRRARRQRRLPDPQQIREYLERIGYEKLTLNCHEVTVELTAPRMRLDLGGIAKGYACDQAVAVLKEHGIESALVDGGGDMVVSQPPPGASGWKIEVLSERSGEPKSTSPRLLVTDCAVATSGDLNQFVEIDGRRYSHIVDPKTGVGLTDRLQVTVVAADGATADALASAISVLGPEKGIGLVDRMCNVEAFIVREGADRSTYPSRGWARLVREE